MHHFSKTLIDWYSKVKRDLPWRETKDPYKIWLSEIILQQTRIDQGLPYYNLFVEKFPSVHDLAAADQQDVLKTWEGLGYYSRARNLHETAKIVSFEFDGVFPDSYEGLLKLKGVGPYTAAAIASISFGQAEPVIDGNVFRFISRFFGIEKDIADTKNRKYFKEVLIDVIDHQEPGTFNQAVMEFGATVCKPSNPQCGSCVFSSACFARTHQKQSMLPVKTKKVKSKEVFLAYLIFRLGDDMLMRKRTEGIWNGLYEFHAIQSDHAIDEGDILKKIDPHFLREISLEEQVTHLLTHRKLRMQFFHVSVKDELSYNQMAKEFELHSFSAEEVVNLPKPKVIVNHLQRALN